MNKKANVVLDELPGWIIKVGLVLIVVMLILVALNGNLREAILGLGGMLR